MEFAIGLICGVAGGVLFHLVSSDPGGLAAENQKLRKHLALKELSDEGEYLYFETKDGEILRYKRLVVDQRG